jgi:hypothetical protein
VFGSGRNPLCLMAPSLGPSLSTKPSRALGIVIDGKYGGGDRFRGVGCDRVGHGFCIHGVMLRFTRAGRVLGVPVPLSPTMFLPAGGASRSCARRSRGNPQGKQRMGCGRKSAQRRIQPTRCAAVRRCAAQAQRGPRPWRPRADMEHDVSVIRGLLAQLRRPDGFDGHKQLVV